MRPYQLTPFARLQMTAGLRDAIEAAVPADHLVHLGRGSGGWTCRILAPDLTVAAETYHEPSPMVAFMAAWSRVK